MEFEDRKRKLEDADTADLEPSKKALQKLSVSGPLTQEDVVLYKKEAIWRQMKFYKLQAQEVKSELQRYESRFKAYVASHLLIESWLATVVKALGKGDIKQLDLTCSSKDAEALLEERRELLLDVFKSNSNIDKDESIAKICDIVALERDKTEAQNLHASLKEKITELENQLRELQMAKDRSESASIKRVQVNNKQKVETSDDNVNGSSNGESTPVEVKKEGVNEEQANIYKKELEDLRIEHDLVKAGLDSVTESLKAANVKLSNAEQTNLDLIHKLNNLDEPELLKSARYVTILSQNKSLNENNSQLLKLKDELVQKLSALEDKEGQFVKSVSTEILEENRHLKELLSKAENDLVRVRTVRDELIGKLAVFKLELEQAKSSKEILALNDILNQRLHKLEETLAAQFAPEVDANLEALEKSELIKRLQILSGELKDLESAFQETRGLALEKLKDFADKDGFVKKLTVEKNKADQKYFASMRVKDLLAAENKILKTQIAKSQELLQKQGDIEKAYASKIDIMNKSLTELKAIKESSIRETSKLYESVKSLTRHREGATKEISQLKEELKTISKQKEALVDELSDIKYTLGKLQGKLRATDSLLQKYKSNNTSSILQEDEKQLEALRSITKCSVCSKNWKNTAITACGHVFCDGCVQERLNARLRRCPTCNKGFSSNDLLSVHL